MKKLVSLTRAFTFGMAALSIPALALARPTFVELGNRGEIIGDGEAAAIPVTIACTDDTTNRVQPTKLLMQVRGPVGEGSGRGEDAFGFGQQDIADCSSRRQTVEAVVTPDPNQRFRRGRSYNATAELYGCGVKPNPKYPELAPNEPDCGAELDRETILLGNFGRPDTK